MVSSMTTAIFSLTTRTMTALWGVIAVAVVAIAVILAIHGHAHATALPATAAKVHQLRQLAIPPIHPLPGATPSEWTSYLHAKASYCALVPQAAICS